MAPLQMPDELGTSYRRSEKCHKGGCNAPPPHAILNESTKQIQMTRDEFSELYTKIYAAYDYAGLKDEYVRSTLGDALDHMILLRKTLYSVPVQKVAQTA